MTTNLLQLQQRGLIHTILLESVLTALDHVRYDALVHSTLRAAFASVILTQATIVWQGEDKTHNKGVRHVCDIESSVLLEAGVAVELGRRVY